MSEKALENQGLRKCVRKKVAILKKKTLLNDRLDQIEHHFGINKIFLDLLQKSIHYLLFSNICNRII